ncbi:MAG: phosphatidate cytidylyltransferase [Bordetella sp.]|nr:MAG: phosphatidate cytidylyltransferase [Bordetella sp.]
MLKKRILSSTFLLIILIGTLSIDNRKLFPIFLALITAISIWEWSCLTLSHFLKQYLSLPVSILFFIGMLILINNWFSGGNFLVRQEMFLMLLTDFIWVFFVIPSVFLGNIKTNRETSIWFFFGLLANFVCWSLLTLNYLNRGTWFIISLLGLVWVVDVLAYFLGKFFGKKNYLQKLALEKP